MTKLKTRNMLSKQNPAVQTRRGWGEGIPWVGVALLVLAVLRVYAPALRAGFIWDDDDYVTQNQALRSFKGLFQIWFSPGATPQYYPLVHSFYWVEYSLWGVQPTGYHLVNVLLHASSALLLWALLRRLALPGALFAAALFALHPVGVESVAWITERKNTLSLVCYLGAAWYYLNFLGIGDNEQARQRRDYLLALGLFLGALLSKTVTCSFPAALLLLMWWKRGRVQKREFIELLPFFAAGLALSFVTVWMEKTNVGATGKPFELGMLQRCLVAGRAFWFYAGKLLWPVPLVFVYPRWQVSSSQPWQFLFPLAALALVGGLWAFRARLGRGPLVAVLFFAGTLFPALGFINVFPMQYSFVADHFQYHASLGLLALFAAAATVAWQKARLERYASAAALLVLVPLGVLTWNQAHIYRDLETLWTDTLNKNPRAAMAHTNLANLRAEQGRVAEAFSGYEDALALEPGEETTNYCYGVTLYRAGQLPRALERFELVLHENPKNGMAHFNKANILGDLGRLAEAVGVYEEAIKLKPDFAEGYVNLGIALARQGRLEEAKARLEKAVALRPDFADAYLNLANVCVEMGKKDQAIAACKKALELRPGWPEAQALWATLAK